MQKMIYLDNNATTPVDPCVLDSMLPFFKDEFGNAASSHDYGTAPQEAIDQAREHAAKLLGAKPEEIIFTSGATESNNIAILGLITPLLSKTPHIITSNVEHKAVLEVCRWAENLGAELTILPANHWGQIQPKQVAQAIRPNTKLVSIMMANNEIGTINDIEAIGDIAHQHGAFMHTDAAQAVGKMAIDIDQQNIDMLSLSAHKIYGPKGIGALYIRKIPALQLKPIMAGGQQEQSLRPGTLNVAGIAGLGKCCQLALEKLSNEIDLLTKWRDQIIEEVLQAVPEAQLNGHPQERLPNNISFSFKDILPTSLTLGLSGIAYSSSSACNTACVAPSHVLSAIGLAKELMSTTVRLGLGRFTTQEDVNAAIAKIIAIAQQHRKMFAQGSSINTLSS